MTMIKKIFLTGKLLLLIVICNAQSPKKTEGFIQLQYNQTLYDRTIRNNPWGMGTGAFFLLQSKTAFRAMAECTADYIFMDDKVLRLNTDGTPLPVVRGTVNLFAGFTIQPARSWMFSLTGGPSFISGGVRAGLKPSVGIFFSSKHQWVGRLSYCNIFNREKVSGKDFGVLTLSVGLKIF